MNLLQSLCNEAIKNFFGEKLFILSFVTTFFPLLQDFPVFIDFFLYSFSGFLMFLSGFLICCSCVVHIAQKSTHLFFHAGAYPVGITHVSICPCFFTQCWYSQEFQLMKVVFASLMRRHELTNKLPSLEASPVQNYDTPTRPQTHSPIHLFQQFKLC